MLITAIFQHIVRFLLTYTRQNKHTVIFKAEPPRAHQ